MYRIVKGRKVYDNVMEAVCGKIVKRNQTITLSAVNPKWNKDWCHECVIAIEWPERMMKEWIKKGIEFPRRKHEE